MNFKFLPQDKVKIIELGVKGVVTSVWFDFGSLQFKVRYFWQGKAEEIYFYENELEKE